MAAIFSWPQCVNRTISLICCECFTGFDALFFPLLFLVVATAECVNLVCIINQINVTLDGWQYSSINTSQGHMACEYLQKITQIAKFMGQTWGPPGSCRSQVGPMLAPWTLLSGYASVVFMQYIPRVVHSFYAFLCFVLYLIVVWFLSLKYPQKAWWSLGHMMGCLGYTWVILFLIKI